MTSIKRLRILMSPGRSSKNSEFPLSFAKPLLRPGCSPKGISDAFYNSISLSLPLPKAFAASLRNVQLGQTPGYHCLSCKTGTFQRRELLCSSLCQRARMANLPAEMNTKIQCIDTSSSTFSLLRPGDIMIGNLLIDVTWRRRNWLCV